MSGLELARLLCIMQENNIEIIDPLKEHGAKE